MSPSCHTPSKAFEISKKQPQHQVEDCNKMMHKFHELLKEVDIRKNQMVENQTDFCTTRCFLVDVKIYYYIEFFQKLYLIQVTEKLVCNFLKALYLIFWALEQCWIFSMNLGYSCVNTILINYRQRFKYCFITTFNHSN